MSVLVLNGLKISIIGAGISGLFSALLLQKHGFDVRIFERSLNLEGLNQGFSLTMQGETKKILQEYDLLESFLELGERSIKQHYLNSKGETLYYDDKHDENTYNYPLPRLSIREILFSKLKPETVLWDNKLIKIEPINQEHKYKLHFKDTSNELSFYDCDIILACDGIRSEVRSQFIKNDKDIKIHDFKLANIYGITKLSKINDTNIKNTTFNVFDGTNRLFSKPFNSEFQMWELTFPIGNTGFDKLYELKEKGQNINQESYQVALDIIKNWNVSWLIPFIEETQIENIIVHPLYDIDPKSINYDELPLGIALLGDSAHAMSPFKGMGANEAIYDAYSFCKILLDNLENIQNIQNIQDVDLAIDFTIQEYHLEMSERTHETVMRSREVTNFYHSIDVLDKEKLYQFKKWT